MKVFMKRTLDNLVDDKFSRIPHRELKQNDSNYQNTKDKKKKKDYSEERKRKRGE